MFVVCESFSRCKGTGIFCCLQTFFCFFGWVVATGGGYRDRGGEQVWNLSRGAAKHSRYGDKKGYELLEHIEKPQVPGGTWGCLWDSCSGRSGESGII